jgi:hypothetical protein
MRRLQAIRQLAAMMAALALTTMAHAQGPPGGGGYGGGGGGYGGGGYGSNGQWIRTVSTSGVSSGTSGLPHSSGSSPWGATQEYANSTGGISFPVGSYKTGNMSATVTYTYAWNGGPNSVPAPKYVVVAAAGFASWMAPKVNGSGSCNVSVSGDLVESTPGSTNSASSVGASISKVAYKVIDSTSGTVTVAVGISSSVSAAVSSDPLSTGGVTQGVGASCQLWSVQLDVNGTTKTTSGEHRILIGQGCRPGLSLVGNVSPANSGATTPVEMDPTGYNWSVTGDKFDSFYVGPNQAIGAMKTCEVVDAASTPPTNRWVTPSPVWRWWRESSSVVNCTAKIRRVGTNAFINNVNGNKTVSVELPTFSCTTATRTSTWWPFPVNAEILTSGLEDAFNNVFDPGISFNGTVGTPTFFRGPGAGTWDFNQLWRPQRTIDGSQISGYFSANYGLDNWWPYVGGFSANSTATVPTPQFTSDTPWMGVGASSVSANDAFKMYMTYYPPDTGQGSAMVTLHLVQWTWVAGGTGELDTSLNTWWAPNPPGTSSVQSSAGTRVHPQWSQKFVNS